MTRMNTPCCTSVMHSKCIGRYPAARSKLSEFGSGKVALYDIALSCTADICCQDISQNVALKPVHFGSFLRLKIATLDPVYQTLFRVLYSTSSCNVEDFLPRGCRKKLLISFALIQRVVLEKKQVAVEYL